MRILVTGGNGFIGSALVRKLVDAGHQIVCLLRASSDTARIADLPFERSPGDVRDPASLRRAATGCHAIVHLASLSSWDLIDSPEMREVVVAGTRNVLDTARVLDGPARVVFVSSATAVGATEEPQLLDEQTEYNLASHTELTYSRLKHEAERLCAEAVRQGADAVVVNPAEVYGPNDTGFVTAGNLLDFARSNPVLVCRGGTSVVYVDDVAAGIAAALERGRTGERYILAGDNLSIRELAELSLELMGLRKPIVSVPNRLLRGVTRLGTRWGIPLPYNPRVIPYATRFWFVDNRKAMRELGVTFRSARQTLAPAIEWLRSAGHLDGRPG